MGTLGTTTDRSLATPRPIDVSPRSSRNKLQLPTVSIFRTATSTNSTCSGDDYSTVHDERPGRDENEAYTRVVPSRHCTRIDMRGQSSTATASCCHEYAATPPPPNCSEYGNTCLRGPTSWTVVGDCPLCEWGPVRKKMLRSTFFSQAKLGKM